MADALSMTQDTRMLNVQGERNSMNIELSYVTYSKYSDECSTLVLNSWASSFDFRSEEFLDLDKEEYDPLQDKFVIRGIEVESNTYLSQTEDGSFSFPKAKELEIEPLILHGPDEINGYENDDFFVGLVANVHNKPSLFYKWFRNGNLLCSGCHQSIIRISEPGTYSCNVQYRGKLLQSSTVDVLAEVQENIREKPANPPAAKPANPSEAHHPPSVSIVTLMKTGKIKIPK